MDFLDLNFPGRSPAGLRKLMKEVRRRKQSTQAATIDLNWQHVFPNPNHRWQTRQKARLANSIINEVSKAPHLQRVHLRISGGVSVGNAEIVTEILNKFPNKVAQLSLDGALLGGDFDGFLESLKAQSHLEALSFTSLSLLPEHASRQIPALFTAIATLPHLKKCEYSSLWSRLELPEADMADALKRLAERPNLNTLDIRSLANCGSLAGMLQALHQSSCALQHLTLGLSQVSTHDEDCQVLKAVGDVLQVNMRLESLELCLGSKTTLLEAITPIEDALRTNKTLISLTLESAASVLLPETFGQTCLQKDNATLQVLEVYSRSVVDGQSTRIPAPLPAMAAFYMKLNRFGRRFLREGSCHSCRDDSTWLHVLSLARDHVDLIYYYLRQNPGLVNPCVDKRRPFQQEHGVPSRKRQRLNLAS